MVFIIKCFRTIVFTFIVISITFPPICPPASFSCLSNPGTFTELRTTSFIESTGVACSDSVSHNRIQVLSTVIANGIRTGDHRGFNKGSSSKFRESSLVRQTPEEGRRIYWPKRCGNNNKDEDNSPKTLNDKNHQASSEKFRQLINILLWIFSFIYWCLHTRSIEKTRRVIFFSFSGWQPWLKANRSMLFLNKWIIGSKHLFIKKQRQRTNPKPFKNNNDLLRLALLTYPLLLSHTHTHSYTHTHTHTHTYIYILNQQWSTNLQSGLLIWKIEISVNMYIYIYIYRERDKQNSISLYSSFNCSEIVSIISHHQETRFSRVKMFKNF